MSASHHEEEHTAHHAAPKANWSWRYAGTVIIVLTLIYFMVSCSGCSFNQPATYYGPAQHQAAHHEEKE